MPTVVPQILHNPKLKSKSEGEGEGEGEGEEDWKMKGLFKSKPKTTVELVLCFRQLLLLHLHPNLDLTGAKRKDKLTELSKVILEVRSVLYGNDNSEPNAEACGKLTQEFFREDTFRLLIQCLPKMELGVQQDAIHVIANLHRQRVNSRLVASDYMENNLDLLDILIPGYEDSDICLTYGAISRECIRHQCVTKYILESGLLKKFFVYMQNPCFEIASDATTTFKELLTRHKSTVAEFLLNNYDWFFHEYNSKMLESTCYITRRQGITILGGMLLDRSNSAVMVRYASSLDNMRILMNLLREPKAIKIEAFHVFKLFVANQNKPPEIVSVLVANKSKLLWFFAGFNSEKEDPKFEADKSQVIAEIAKLQPRDPPCTENAEDCEMQC